MINLDIVTLAGHIQNRTVIKVSRQQTNIHSGGHKYYAQILMNLQLLLNCDQCKVGVLISLMYFIDNQVGYIAKEILAIGHNGTQQTAAGCINQIGGFAQAT